MTKTKKYMVKGVIDPSTSAIFFVSVIGIWNLEFI
jgi:hypothetical protein